MANCEKAFTELFNAVISKFRILVALYFSIIVKAAVLAILDTKEAEL